MSDRIYRRYDHRLRNMIVESGDPNLFPELAIPKSTIREWLKNGLVDVVTTASLNHDQSLLALKVARYEKEINELRAEKKLYTKVIKICGFTIQYKRFPSEELKADILLLVQQAIRFLSLAACLELIGLSSARYHHWIRKARKCSLKDLSSCPKSVPTRLTSAEIGIAKELILNPDYFHFSITSLSWYAKKTGLLFASPATWSKIVRRYKLRRTRKRQYPAKPKIGIRAHSPGEIWHLDMSVIKLVDNTKCYIQAVIDNYSRYVIVWKVSKDYGGVRTRDLILEAIKHTSSVGMNNSPNIFVDSGVENINSRVDELVETKLITRTIAQIDIEFSNSMIESLFYRLKHRFLYLQTLTDFDSLSKYVDSYLADANHKIPLAVLGGGTPFEVFTGIWSDEHIKALNENAQVAVGNRYHVNKLASCGQCLI